MAHKLSYLGNREYYCPGCQQTVKKDEVTAFALTPCPGDAANTSGLKVANQVKAEVLKMAEDVANLHETLEDVKLRVGTLEVKEALK